MNVPAVDPQRVREGLRANRHFAAVLVVLLLVLAAFPGSPARSLFEDIASSQPLAAAPVTSPAVTVPPPPVDLFNPSARTALPGSFGPTLAAEPGPPGDPAPPTLVDPVALPPAPEPEPEPTCDTDALFDALDLVRGPLGDLLGAPAPGGSLRELAAISAGCSDADPTGPVLDLALELGPLVPDTGLGIIDLPDLPGIDLPVPPELVDLLAPLAPGIREGCSQLATVALLFVVLPPAFSLPFSQSDLIQFLGPATALCALFDEAGDG